MALDKIDYKIIKILQEEARITNIELSSRIGLSPGPTLARLKKLEQQGYIKSYHANVDEERMGIGIKAFIQISLNRQIEYAIKNFKKQVQDIDEITECYQITGNSDYMLKAKVKDIRSFEKLIGEKLSKIEEIGQMQTMVILATAKESKVLPLDYEKGRN